MNGEGRRRRAVLTGAVLLGIGLTCPSLTTQSLPVFPGAEGFGTTTVAGRGGAILRVTNLNDSGTGSLRAALAASGPRTVVFEIGGTLTLTSNDLMVTNPYLTVAGQTAPSPGITIRGGGIRVITHDVLIQHLRVRPGDALAHRVYPGNSGAFMVLGQEGRTHDASSTYNVVLDHVSAGWTTDQCVSTWFPLHDVTVSNSLIAEGLRDHGTRRPGQCHACGFLIGEHGARVAIIRTLFAHHANRFPAIKGGTRTLLVNNLAYNNANELIDLNDYDRQGPHEATIVGNVHIPGPDTTALSTRTQPLIYLNANLKPGTRIFETDNVSPTVLLNHVAGFNPIVSTPPVPADGVTLRSSRDVEAFLRAHAGARPADRDEVDLRIVAELTSRSGRIIDAPQDVGGYPPVAVTVRPLALPRNPGADDDGDGYTNLEEWLWTFSAEVEGTAVHPQDVAGLRIVNH